MTGRRETAERSFAPSSLRSLPAGERTADEPHVALRDPEGVADVAGAVAVDVARLGVHGLATKAQA